MATLLLVCEPDVVALLIREERNVDGSGPMTLIELPGGANVDQRTCRFAECLDTDCCRDAHA